MKILGKDAKKISLGVSFSSGQPQWNTMASLIKYYNEAHKNDKHFLPVELKTLRFRLPWRWKHSHHRIKSKKKWSC
nr:hypothetical protein [Mycoplasmopsis bovis]